MKKSILLLLLVLCACQPWQDINAKPIEKKEWTLLTFWAEWCDHCIEEIPALNKIHASGKTQVVGWSVDQQPAHVLLELQKRYHIEFILAEKLPRGFIQDNHMGVPKHYLQTEDGKWYGPKIGKMDAQKLAEFKKEVLAAQKAAKSKKEAVEMQMATS